MDILIEPKVELPEVSYFNIYHIKISKLVFNLGMFLIYVENVSIDISK